MSTQNASTSSIISSVVFNSVIFGGSVAGFLILRLKFKRIYQPKSLEIISKYNRSQKYVEPLPPGILSWIPALLLKPKSFVIQQAGLDGYFFLRYLIVFGSVAFVSLLIVFPILIPINVTGKQGKKGLDMLTFSNVKDHNRFYAHAILSLIFYPFVLYIIYRELLYYTYTRESVLASPKYAKKLASRVVLFQSVPKQYLNESEFSKLFDGVKRIWKANAAKQLEEKVKERNEVATDLENTLCSLLGQAVKAKLKADAEGVVLEPADELVAYVPQKKRPTVRKHKFVGTKSDKVYHIKQELIRLNKEIENLKNDDGKKSTMNSIFVEFENQYWAQIASQTVVHHKPLTMAQHYIGIAPPDIIWTNMRLFWYERLVRKTVAVAAIVALVIFWAIPVAFVGVISNVSYLTEKIHFLRFLNKLPDLWMGLVTALLPTILLAVLMAVLPIFIRTMAKVSGAPSAQHVEYFTQQAYFAFQVIQVFLVTTISSSATSVVTQIIDNPTSAMSLLSSNLPSASNFYVSYIVLQSFSIAGGMFLQSSQLVLFYLLSFVLDKTPRKKWNRYTALGSNSWGTDFPPYTNLVVISLTYVIISPLMLLFTAVGFAILYFAYLYYLCYVNNNSAKDSRGIHYPRALFQTITGIYLGQICLLGLFVVAKAWGAVAIDAVGLGITVFVHLNLNTAFDNIITVLPVDTMKPLDGISSTPSYSKESVDDISMASSLKEKTTSKEKIPENQFSKVKTMNVDSLASVPLLADGTEEDVTGYNDNAIVRFFKPHVYLTYHYCKQTLPEVYNHADEEDLNEEENEKAYRYPAVYAPDPIVWIPEDPMGVGKNLAKDFEGVIEISTVNAVFEKAKMTYVGPPPGTEGI